jgi:hypothetical protein
MHLHGPDSREGPVSFSGCWKTASARKPGRTHEEEEVRDRAPIRVDLVEQIRKEIAAGTYVTTEKWEAALDCLLSRLECD